MVQRTLHQFLPASLGLVALILGISGLAWAQSGRTRPTAPPATKISKPESETPKPPPPKPSETVGPVYDTDETIRVEATLVSVPVVVSDENGRYLPFLTKEKFRLYEDGVVQDISFFAPERVPFHVALVLDTSGSTFLSMNDMQSAAIAFVEQLRDEDQVSVISFDSNVHVLCDFTNDREMLREAILETRSGGSTKLYEAVYQTVTRQMHGIEGRKAMILLTDGEDTSSKKVSYREAIDAVVESNVLTYVIRYPAASPMMTTGPTRPGRMPGPIQIPIPGMPFPLPWPRGPRTPPQRPPTYPFLPPQGKIPQQPGPTASPSYSKSTFLYDLARSTGGELYNFETMGALSTVFSTIAEELRHVYVLGYYPTNPLEKGGWRRLRVEVSDQEARIRARSGYYAKAPLQDGRPNENNTDVRPFHVSAR